MEDYVIELNGDVNNFKEIFFKNGQGNIIHNSVTKKPLRYIVLFALLTIGFYFLGFVLVSLSWLFILGVFFTVIAILFFINEALKFYSWKSNIKKYLQNVADIKNSRLKLKSDVFELQIDDRTIIERLGYLKKVDMDSSRISLIGETENYFFPSKAMKPEDFFFFSSYLKERIANGGSV